MTNIPVKVIRKKWVAGQTKEWFRKKVDNMEKLLKDLTEKFNKCAALNNCYVEEEIIEDVKYV